MIHSLKRSEKTVKKRNSYTVVLSNNDIFEIKIFEILMKTEQEKEHELAIRRYFQKLESTLVTGKELENLIIVDKKPRHLTAIHLRDVQEKVTMINIIKLNYNVVLVHPNKSELLS